MQPEECPITTTINVIGGRWKPVILHYLARGTQRSGDLRRLIPGSTQKVLTQQLRELEREKIVRREIYAAVPPRVEYSLTPYGMTLEPLLQAMCEWGERHGARP